MQTTKHWQLLAKRRIAPKALASKQLCFVARGKSSSKQPQALQQL